MEYDVLKQCWCNCVIATFSFILSSTVVLGGFTEKHCVLSDWSQWSPCNATCSLGYSSMVRHIVQRPSGLFAQPCHLNRTHVRRCGEQNNGCQQFCEKTTGRCLCTTGYELASDGKRCFNNTLPHPSSTKITRSPTAKVTTTLKTNAATMPTPATGATTSENMLYIVIGLLTFLIGCLIVVICCRRERHSNTSCCCCWGKDVKGGSEELTIGTTHRVAVEMSDIPAGMVLLRASSNGTKFVIGV